MHSDLSSAAPTDGAPLSVRRLFGVLAYGRRALGLAWDTSPRLTLLLAGLTLVAGAMPAAIAWVGKLIVDDVVALLALPTEQRVLGGLFTLIAVEGGLVALMTGAQRGLAVCRTLLRAQMGHRINMLILDKALELPLARFEDSEFYDKLTRARREASLRPLSLVSRTFDLVQNGVSLASYGVLLVQFSPWALLALVVAGLPAFVVEARFSGEAFFLYRWKSPETRRQVYLETVLAREDSAKEVKIFGLGPHLLQRYRAIFHDLYRRERSLALRRDLWGWLLGLVGSFAFYGAYAWVGYATVVGRLSLGEMTMYLLLFRQGQQAVASSLGSISGMYEDNLYLTTLDEYLQQPDREPGGGATAGAVPGDGIRFERVGFTYPGAEQPALANVSFHLRPGTGLALVGENGSGKTTLIKLLCRLYRPSEGRILLDGTPLEDWELEALRQRVSVVFQDFMRYQFVAGENIGVGDVPRLEDEAGWQEAARLSGADSFLERLPNRYHTQLGRWFPGGVELSGGQWQKVALARALFRRKADILVLDEPTAAMDPRAEAEVFAHVRRIARSRMTILVSHRFSTVRMADTILVLDRGRVREQGSHDSLMAQGGLYAQLFQLQADALLGR